MIGSFQLIVVIEGLAFGLHEGYVFIYVNIRYPMKYKFFQLLLICL